MNSRKQSKLNRPLPSSHSEKLHLLYRSLAIAINSLITCDDRMTMEDRNYAR